MNYPMYKGPQRFTYKEIQRLFYIKYENGFITKKISNNHNIKYSVIVNYTNGGKSYNYSVGSYVELALKLDISKEATEAQKVFKKESKVYTAYTQTKEYMQDIKDNDIFGIF